MDLNGLIPFRFLFVLQGVSEVAQEATKTARNIVQLRENHRSLIASRINSSGSAYQLLEYLYKRPIITVNGVVKVTDLSYANANNLVAKFQELGLLRQMDTYLRNRRFQYSDYLAMFADEKISRNEQEILTEQKEEKTES